MMTLVIHSKEPEGGQQCQADAHHWLKGSYINISQMSGVCQAAECGRTPYSIWIPSSDGTALHKG